jgi:hypothetical protein
MPSADARLRALERNRPAPSDPVDLARMLHRYALWSYLGAQGPGESPADAAARLAGVRPGRPGFADAISHVLAPLRGLDGAAFATACERIRALHLAGGRNEAA